MKRVTNVLRNMFGMDKEWRRNNETVTNAQILKETVRHFTEELNYRSVGKKMIYPMSFYIHLHPDDYQIRKDDFPFFLTEVVDEFYEVILKKMKRYSYYKGVSAYWNFYLVPCMESVLSLGGHDFAIEPGKVIIWSSLYDLSDKEPVGNNRNINISVSLEKSKLLTNLSLNPEIMANLQFVSESHLRVNWKDPIKVQQEVMPLAWKEEQILPNMKIELAVLSFVQVGRKVEQFTMRANTCKISNERDSRQDSSIFKIKHSKVEIQHAEIKYDKATNTFELAAYQQTAINGMEIPLSKGDDIKWVSLKNGAVIVLSGSAVINFKQLI